MKAIIIQFQGELPTAKHLDEYMEDLAESFSKGITDLNDNFNITVLSDEDVSKALINGIYETKESKINNFSMDIMLPITRFCEEVNAKIGNPMNKKDISFNAKFIQALNRQLFSNHVKCAIPAIMGVKKEDNNGITNLLKLKGLIELPEFLRSYSSICNLPYGKTM